MFMVRLFRLLGRLPLPLMQRVGALLGWLTWRLSGTYRRRFEDHASAAGFSPSEYRPARAAIGTMVAELPWLWLRPQGQGVLHLATVFTPDAPLQRRATVREAMRRWSDGLSFGPVAVRWHAWTLQGPRATWGRQLEALAQRQPVFALVSGAGGAGPQLMPRLPAARNSPTVGASQRRRVR